LADGLVREIDLQVAADSAWVWPQHPAPEAGWIASCVPAEAAARSAEWVSHYVGWIQDPLHWQVLAAEEERVQCEILRDLCGIPFRQVRAEPSWMTVAVLDLGQRIYATRDFGQIGQLANAMQVAGCASGEVLGHCLQTGRHVRGCWVLDLLLGKE
jgi:hypothetical protein